MGEDASRVECVLLKRLLFCRFIKMLLVREPFSKWLEAEDESCKVVNAKPPVEKAEAPNREIC